MDYNLKLLEIFRRFDLNHNHKINHAELRNLMMAAGWRDDGELVDRLMATYDNDRDGSLNFEEFVTMWGQNRDRFPISW